MTTQPTALRLADDLDRGWAYKTECAETAAELRRLSVVEAQRDALLEVLKELTGHANERFSGGVWDRARAAIKAVEGEKT